LLRAKTGLFWGNEAFLRGPGLPGQDRLVIYRRRRTGRNSFRILAYIRATAGGRGTRIDVALRSSRAVAGFMTIWIGIVILVNLVILIQAIVGGAHLNDLWFTVLFPVYGFGLLALGRRMSRADGPALLGFIRQTCDAQDMAPELRPSS
jgi:hypothetical protein